MRLRPLDLAAVLLAAAAIGLVARWAYASGTGTPELTVQGARGSYSYPLWPDRRVEVDGPLGLTTMEIRGRSARIVDSPSKNKLCTANLPLPLAVDLLPFPGYLALVNVLGMSVISGSLLSFVALFSLASTLGAALGFFAERFSVSSRWYARAAGGGEAGARAHRLDCRLGLHLL